MHGCRIRDNIRCPEWQNPLTKNKRLDRGGGRNLSRGESYSLFLASGVVPILAFGERGEAASVNEAADKLFTLIADRLKPIAS